MTSVPFTVAVLLTYGLLALVLWSPRVRVRRPMVVVAALAGLNAWGTQLLGPCAPMQHDDFALLLMADTFAHGRLTNPTPAGWEHFESVHQLVLPTYQGKYPVAPAVVLAVGQVLTGEPLVGVILVFALAAAAVVWLLRAVLAERWALVGGLVCAGHPGLLCGGDYGWTRTYWGTAPALIGAALLYGGVWRLHKGRRGALAVGVGLLLLANSRPFEGAVVSVSALVSLVRLPWRRWWPAGGVLLIGAVGMGIYNHAVTGSALRLPYQEHARQYGYAPLFVWQSLGAEPAYRVAEMRAFHTGWELSHYQAQTTLAGWWAVALNKWHRMWEFYARTLSLALLCVPLAWHARWVRLALVAIGLVLLALTLSTWAQPHYAGPAVGLLCAVAVASLRAAQLVRPLRATGRWLALAFVGLLAADTLNLARTSAVPAASSWHWQRAAVAEWLQGQPGTQLVFVTYPPGWTGAQEWVYNRADLQGAQTVWARARGADADAALRTLHPGRHVWRLRVNADGYQLTAEP